MKIINLYLIILFSTHFIIAQENNEFSKAKKEVNKILKSKKKDIYKVDILRQKVKESLPINPQVSFFYNDESLKLAKSIKYQKGIANAFLMKSHLFNAQSDYKQALIDNNKAFKIAEKFDLDTVKASIQRLKGDIYIRIGKYKKAIKIYKEVAKVYKKMGLKKELTKCYNSLANIYTDQGVLVEALSYFQKSLTISKKINNYGGIAMCYSGIGRIYSIQGEVDKALNTYKKSLKIFKKLNNQKSIGNIYGNLGNLYFKLKKDVRKALKYYEKSLEINKKINNKAKIVLSNNSLGDCFRKLGKYKKAEKHYKKALSLAQEIRISPNIIMIVEFGLGNLYAQQSKTMLSIEHYEKAYQIAKKIPHQHTIHATTRVLALSYGQGKNYEKAYKYQKEFTKISDSLLNEKNIRKITAMEKDLEFEQERKITKIKQEKEKALQEAKLKEQKTQTFILGIGITLSFLILIYLYYNNRQRLQKNRLLASQKEEIETQAEELNDLNQTKDQFFAIIAHDLQSPIAAFQSIAEQLNFYLDKQDTEKIRLLSQNINDSAQNINNLLSNLLSWALLQKKILQPQPQTITLKPVVEEVVKIYNSIIKLQQTKVILNIASDIKLYIDENNLKTIFRNLISNALKFTPKNGEISIKTYEQNKNIIISVTDNGLGIEKEKLASLLKIDKVENKKDIHGKKGTGLGLILVSEFVAINQGKIQIESEVKKGTKVTMTFPKPEFIPHK